MVEGRRILVAGFVEIGGVRVRNGRRHTHSSGMTLFEKHISNLLLCCLIIKEISSTCYDRASGCR